MRRLPIYLLIDTSSSMGGAPIQGVREGLQGLLDTLRTEPQALETVFVSIITFASEAQVLVPLIELTEIQIPKISVRGKTALGAGLSLLAERITAEVVDSTTDRKGDWKPLVFLMSDGGPSDDWEEGMTRLSQCNLGSFIAFGCGKKVHLEVLKQLTPDVMTADSVDPQAFKSFLRWVTASISVNSQRIERGEKSVSRISDLPPPPAEINVVL